MTAVWISPNHPNPPRQYNQVPPADDGEPLAVLPRNRGREELRVALKTFEGHRYVSVRLWERDESGQLWPVKGKGISIRLSEVREVAEALASVEAMAGPTDRRQNKLFSPEGPQGSRHGWTADDAVGRQ